MSKKTVYLLLTCCAGGLAAVSGWLVGDELFARRQVAEAEPAMITAYPAPNRDVKQDRFLIAAKAVETTSAIPAPMVASYAPEQTNFESARAELTSAPPPQARPKIVAKIEKPSRAFLNDTQITGIKWRLNLDEKQEKYWPPVEKALRGLTEQIMDYQKRLKKSRDDSFDTESAEIKQLKSAAKIFLAQLRDEQKSEVVTLANMAGLGPIVAQLASGRDVAKN